MMPTSHRHSTLSIACVCVQRFSCEEDMGELKVYFGSTNGYSYLAEIQQSTSVRSAVSTAAHQKERACLSETATKLC